MSSLYRRSSCTPTEALSLIGQAARLGTESLRDIRLAIGAGPVKYVTLWTKVAPASQADAEADKLQFLDKEADLPESSLDLEHGLARLLLASRGGAKKRAEPNQEVLFVVPGQDMPRLVAALRRLEYCGPSPRVACFRLASGENLCLLHILEDLERRSGAAGLRRAGFFEGWEELKCYPAERLRVFLPEDAAPEGEFFRAFSEMCRIETVADAAHLTPQGPDRELFFVIRRDPATKHGFEVLHLPRLAFFDSAEVGTPAAAEVRIVNIPSALTAGDLGSALRQREPGVGYRLRLRESRTTQDGNLERERLRIRQAEVEQRLAHLESIEKPRPYLLRFSQRQLRALAHTVYSFPAEAVSGPGSRIDYAFQASAREPGGFHYLLVSPEAVRKELDPLPLYDSDAPMKFWLDPSWARYYPEEGNVCYIFVPEHTALFPSLHSWAAEKMDRHMRQALERRWPQGDPFPEDPYYVFDLPAPGEEALELTVLGARDFKPLQTRLQWINDNVTIAHAIPIEGALADAAAAARWKALAEDRRSGAREALAAFQAEARETVESFALELEGVVNQVAMETDGIFLRTDETLAEVQRLSARLKVLVDVKGRKNRTLPALEQLIVGLGETAKEFDDQVAMIERDRILPAFARYRTVLEEQTRRLNDLIEEMKNRHADLLSRLG